MTTIPDLVDKYAGEMARLVTASQTNPKTIEGKSWSVLFADSLFRFHHECEASGREANNRLMKSIVNPSVVDRALQALVTRRKK